MNVFGARQLADRLAASFPASAAALRVQGFAALRADDPAAAVQSFTASLALPAPGGPQSDENTRTGVAADAGAGPNHGGRWR